MDAWLIGLIAVCAVGLGAIVFGALHDRARHRRQVAELTSAPDRSIPSFAGTAAAPPSYLSELQARRPPATPSTVLDRGERSKLSAALEQSDTVTVKVGYASKDFVTDPEPGWAVLDSPRVLACAEPVTSLREILALLEKAVLSDTALVIVAPAVDPQVLETLEVNRIQQKMKILVVLSKDPKPVDAICTATMARLIGRADLQAGYVTGAELGACERWVSSARASHLIGPATRNAASGPAGAEPAPREES